MPTNVLVLNKSWLVTGAGAPEGVHAGPVGSVYLREDGGTGTSLYIKESGTGNTGWVAVAPSAGGGAPAAHAPTHKTGGSDPIKLDELGTPTDVTALNASTSAHGLMQKYPGGTTTWLRADGFFATVPATPLAAHAPTHKSNGTDPLALDGSQITTGTVPLARLPTSVQTLGTWTAVPFSAANFVSGGGGGTWTVGAGAIITNRYTVIGKTVSWSLYVSWFSGSNTLAGTVTTLRVTLPAVTFPTAIYQPVAYAIDGGALVDLIANPDPATGNLLFTKKNGTNFTAGSPGFIGTFTLEIS